MENFTRYHTGKHPPVTHIHILSPYYLISLPNPLAGHCIEANRFRIDIEHLQHVLHSKFLKPIMSNQIIFTA